MKYFGWSEQECLNMPYDKFKMYMLTIPDYDSDDDEDDKDGNGNKPTKTGSINLFDLDQRQQ